MLNENWRLRANNFKYMERKKGAHPKSQNIPARFSSSKKKKKRDKNCAIFGIIRDAVFTQTGNSL